MDIIDSQVFLEKAEESFKKLFDDAKKKDELHFAFSLSPEFRPYRVNTATDAQRAVDDYLDFLKKNEKSPLRARIALALYSHISEASGLWEVLKNLLNVIDGGKYNMMPFLDIVKKYGSDEGAVPPNVNKVMRSLINYSESLGYKELAEVFKEAFDYDLRNGYAHADYALLNEGVCVGPRYNKERIICWKEFNDLLNRAVDFYTVFRSVLSDNLHYYSEPKIVTGFLNDKEPESTWKIHYKKGEGLTITGGIGYVPKRD